MSEKDKSNIQLKKLSENLSADIIIYSGNIDGYGADKIVELTRETTNENVLLLLCTPGGLPDSAYKIAKRLQKQYKNFFLYVYGYCKSAGTLIAIGSDEIIMGDLAEFGPLDVQVSDGEEIGRLSSGLNVFETLNMLKSQYDGYFKESLVDLVKSGGLSTKNAAPIAAQLASGMYSPIISNIDPLKIGELSRAMQIGIDYGEELIKNKRGNIDKNSLVKLATTYNDHGYVIDFEQASQIFKSVRADDQLEQSVTEEYKNIIRYPQKNTFVLKLYGKDKVNESKKKQGTKRSGKKTTRTSKNERSNISKLNPKKSSARK